jgi:hypothetical protein
MPVTAMAAITAMRPGYAMKALQMLWIRIAMVVVLMGVPALGGTLGVEFDTTDPLVIFLESDAMIGFAFQPTTDFTIDGLGLWGPDSFGTAVRLYDASARVLAAALVLPRDPKVGPEVLSYHIAPITPLLLTVGNTYYVAGYAENGDPVVVDNKNPETHPFIEYMGAVSQVGLGLPRSPMFTPLGSCDRFGLVNFRIAGQTAGEVGIPGGGRFLVRGRFPET